VLFKLQSQPFCPEAGEALFMYPVQEGEYLSFFKTFTGDIILKEGCSCLLKINTIVLPALIRNTRVC